MAGGLQSPINQMISKAESNKKAKLTMTFVWTDEHQKAFESLQDNLTITSVLGYPKLTRHFILEIDAF